MTEFAGNWIKAIACAAIICAAASALTPKGKVKSVQKLICGIVLIMAIISPLLNKDMPELSLDMSKYREEADKIVQNSESKENRLSRTIIENELNAYILDKAKSLGVTLQSVKISMRWSDQECWYPYEVTLSGKIAQREKDLVAGAIEAELGIPKLRQHWSEDEK